MKKTKQYPITNWTRLFLVHDNGKAEFIHSIMPWRIMWNGGKERVILRERVMTKDGWLYDFPEGCTLDLLGGHCEKAENRNAGVWLFRFENCIVNRSWIPNAGALSDYELGALDLWIEIDCLIVPKMENLEEGT